jgi:hypothetical protein
MSVLVAISTGTSGSMPCLRTRRPLAVSHWLVLNVNKELTGDLDGLLQQPTWIVSYIHDEAGTGQNCGFGRYWWCTVTGERACSRGILAVLLVCSDAKQTSDGRHSFETTS